MEAAREDHGLMRITRAIGVLAGATLLLALGPALHAGAQTSAATPTVKVLTLDGAVDPFVANYLKKGIEAANRDGDTAVVIRIDTPGGLDSSMRTIIKAIQNSKVPVLCWTGPSGARAASAGTFIMMACPENGMAPGTNIGAAHPVGVSGAIEQKKVTNDAVAFIRSLAEANGYNAEWAESAVSGAKAISAQEAFDKTPNKVTKHIAATLPIYLDEVDGKIVPADGGHLSMTLDTTNATLQAQSPGLGVSLLHGLIDPNLAFIFFYLGIILIIIEVLHPGISVPGVLGTLLLVASIMSFGILPVQLGGVLLLVASAVLYLLELKHPGIGLPAVGGTICLVLGGLLLFDPSVPDLRVSRWLLVVVPTLVVAFFAVVVQAALEARRQPPMIGTDHLYGEEGIALTDLAPRGEVRVGHEHWSAESVQGAISAGTVIRVVGRSGLRLTVVADPTQIGGDPMAPSLPHSGQADQTGDR
jgi:membrane-bound serine protease (ClpP class)